MTIDANNCLLCIKNNIPEYHLIDVFEQISKDYQTKDLWLEDDNKQTIIVREYND